MDHHLNIFHDSDVQRLYWLSLGHSRKINFTISELLNFLNGIPTERYVLCATLPLHYSRHWTHGFEVTSSCLLQSWGIAVLGNPSTLHFREEELVQLSLLLLGHHVPLLLVVVSEGDSARISRHSHQFRGGLVITSELEQGPEPNI